MQDQIIHVAEGDADEASDLKAALEIGRVLERHYPNHPWMISFSSHALVIRHLPIANAVAMATGKEGFGSVLPPHKASSYKSLAQEAVRHAGALLEQFSLPRGAWDGRDPIVPQALIAAVRRGNQRAINQGG
jgi:hypothetical protein